MVRLRAKKIGSLLEKTRQYAQGNEAGAFTTTTHSVRLHSDSRDLDCAAGAFGYTATVIDRISPASMKNANHATIVNFLASNGVIDAKQVREITGDLISTNLYMSD